MRSIKFLLSFSVLLLLSFVTPTSYTCRTGHLHIETSNRFTNVIADNYQVFSTINPENGKITCVGLVKSFEFKFGALDQAFNSSRVKLDQYSKFRYEGEIKNLNSVEFDKPGTYSAEVKGFLYIGTYKRLTNTAGTITIQPDGKLQIKANFNIKIEEASMNTINDLMKNKLPSVVSLDTDKLGISRDIYLSLSAKYKPK